MATDVGGVFEDELEAVFRVLKEEYLLGWHRFPDTHSAGGMVIQPQPSDYLVGIPSGGGLPTSDQRLVFLEAKATEKHSSLQKSAVSPHQRGFINLYSGMLNVPYIICHYSTVTGNIQLWDGMAVTGEGRVNKGSLMVEFAAGSGRKLNKDAAVQGFVDFFSLPSKVKTLKRYQEKCL